MLFLASAVQLFSVFLFFVFCVLLVFLAAQGANLHFWLLAVPALQMQQR
jgi:hypothetical protein